VAALQAALAALETEASPAARLQQARNLLASVRTLATRMEAAGLP
jgi:hypothetical protein